MTNTNAFVKNRFQATDPVVRFRLGGRIVVATGVSEGIVVVRTRMGRMA